MLSAGFPSWRLLIFFVLYLFSQSANSAAILRPAAPTQSLWRPVEARETADAPARSTTTFTDLPATFTDLPATFTGLPGTGLPEPTLGGAGGPGIAVLPVGLPQEEVSTGFSISVTVVTGTTAVPVTVNGIATVSHSLFTSTSTSFVPVATITGQTDANVQRNGPNKVGLVTAVTVCGVVVLSLVLWAILRRRRRAALRNTELLTARGSDSKGLPTPFNLESPDVGSESGGNRASWAPYINRLTIRQALTPSNTVSTRQLYIANQVNTAREKVAELEAETSTLLRQSSHSSDSHQEGIPSGTDEVSADDLNSSGIYERLERAIQQIEGLNDRIRELERERRSSWALGLSDEAPPGYIE